ncbi:MAG: molybdopterin-guanine dinucleotide biosynthesis protein B [Deltaproteobacteria bacterium]|nr:molybdopterin-guanine dinucleotide biosynthesis protein B [Deltaproteobacteria bacterium]
MAALRLQSKQWLVDDDDHIIMGEGRQEILETIERTGSLNQTAKIMKMSYKAVWGKVKATEKALNMTIVKTDRKLGSHLTTEGKKLLEKYTRLKKECLEVDDRIFNALFTHSKNDSINPVKKPVMVSIVGKSGSGKTTLIEKLIPELIKVGLHVGTIKHHLHDIEMDSPGKDSWRHKHAGAETAIIATAHQIGIVMDTDHDLSPDELLSFFPDKDIVLIEGYKYGKQLKVEIFRPQVHKEPISTKDKSLIAMVSDADLDLQVPRFRLDDVSNLAGFLLEYFGLERDQRI